MPLELVNKDAPEQVRTPAVGYVRCSSYGQDFESQRILILAFAEKNNYQIIAWYEDIGRREESEKRKDFQRLMKDVRNRQVQVVIVENKKRFGTKGYAHEFGHWMYEFQKNGVELWSTSISEGLLTAADIKSKITADIDDDSSDKELLDKAERQIKGRLILVKEGKYVGGFVPHGYDVVVLDKQGKYKHHVIFEGKLRRIKVDLDGTETVYEGEKNFPGRDKEDYAKLALSSRKDRIEAIKRIFGSSGGSERNSRPDVS